jgi:Ser/Thr protein kinase RdoA (MazF antagonist)
MTDVAAGSMVATRPRLADDVLAALLERVWGIGGSLSPLPSERDQNVRVDVGGRPTYVLKIANPREQPAFLDAQDAVLTRLVAAGLPVGRSVPPLDRSVVSVPVAGQPARVRLVTWLDGTPVASATSRSTDLPNALGALMGRVTVALDGLTHPGADRPFQWDVRRAPETVRAALPAVADPGRRVLLERALERLHAAGPRLDRLRRSVLHNDANDHNVLLDDAGRIAGLLDLGDMVWSITAAEAAVAAVYLIDPSRDPQTVASTVVAGFERAFPLRDDERSAIPDLLLARMAISVSISAVQATLDPDPYLRISEDAMWRRLERMVP